ncbi:MAG: aromatic ring-hydroxylating dioxygenase subunit alpha [Rhodospirillales bacterium]
MPGSHVQSRPVTAGQGLDPSAYCDPAIAERETAQLFRASWVGLGRADQIAKPGDYVTRDIAGASLILIRDRNGTPHAFANVCRHRGSRLLDGEGNCRLVRCPFHSWSYAPDGRLAVAPHMDEVDGFDASTHGLIEYPLAERLGFLFVSLGGDAGPVDDWLGDFDAVHAPWPLADMTTYRKRYLTVACNWKAFLDVFNEYYHLGSVHPRSIDSLYARPEAPDAVRGQFASQFGVTKGTGALLEDRQDLALPAMPGLEAPWRDGVRYTWAFPSMTFAAGRDALWVYEAYPDGPDACSVVQTVCFHPETMTSPGFADRAAAYVERADAALDEDIPALAFQHRGLMSCDAVAGPLHGLLEASVLRFARWWETKMA